MTPLWMKQFYKAADLVVKIPVGVSYWPTNMHEGCLLGFCFPYIRFAPWRIRYTPKVCSLCRTLSRMWKEGDVDPGPVLRKFCMESRRLPQMPWGMVRKLLYFK